MPNWVGDVCKALPAVHMLREAGFHLHFAVRKSLVDLVTGFDRPILKLGKGILGPARVMRSAGCNRGLVIPVSFSAAAVARLAGIRAVGFRADYRDRLLHRAVDVPHDEHEVTALVSLARVAHETFAPDAPWPNVEWSDGVPDALGLPLTGRHLAEAVEVLARAGVDGPFVVLCPLATGTRDGHSKVWPHWTELSRRLAHSGHRLVVCPGPGEEAECAAALPEAMLLTGLGLGAYAAVCARAVQVIANDSGPLHLAAAAGANALGIYGLSVPAGATPVGADHIGFDGGWPGVDDVLARLDI